jgi:hypothetical protein
MARRPHEEAVRPPRRLAGLDKFPVALAWGKHLFPFRTEQLSPTAPMVLGPHGPGRVGRRRFFIQFRAAPPGGSSRLSHGQRATGPRPPAGVTRFANGAADEHQLRWVGRRRCRPRRPSFGRVAPLYGDMEAVARSLARWRNPQRRAVLLCGRSTTPKQDGGGRTGRRARHSASRTLQAATAATPARQLRAVLPACVGDIDNHDAPARLCATASICAAKPPRTSAGRDRTHHGAHASLDRRCESLAAPRPSGCASSAGAMTPTARALP